MQVQREMREERSARCGLGGRLQPLVILADIFVTGAATAALTAHGRRVEANLPFTNPNAHHAVNHAGFDMKCDADVMYRDFTLRANKIA